MNKEIIEEEIEETQSFVVAGLSLKRPISVNDVKWAVEEGFNKGYKKALQLKEEEIKLETT